MEPQQSIVISALDLCKMWSYTGFYGLSGIQHNMPSTLKDIFASLQEEANLCEILYLSYHLKSCELCSLSGYLDNFDNFFIENFYKLCNLKQSKEFGGDHQGFSLTLAGGGFTLRKKQTFC